MIYFEEVFDLTNRDNFCECAIIYEDSQAPSLPAIHPKIICSDCKYCIYIVGNKLVCIQTTINTIDVLMFNDYTLITGRRSINYSIVAQPIDPKTFHETVKRRLLLL